MTREKMIQVILPGCCVLMGNKSGNSSRFDYFYCFLSIQETNHLPTIH
jgi:hypothetical protein